MSKILNSLNILNNANFTYVNTLTVDNVGNGIHLRHPYNASGNSISCLVISTPTAPYSITARIRNEINYAASGKYEDTGVCWRNSSSGKIIFFRKTNLGNAETNYQETGFGYLECVTFTSTTSAASTVMTATPNIYWNIKWFKLVDDNVNRIIYISNNGINWYQMFSESRTNFITPNQVGVACNGYQSNNGYNFFDFFRVDYSS